jgi:hypothetical protein
VIERRDVFASPFRYESAIAPKKKVVVQVALWNASDCVQFTSRSAGGEVAAEAACISASVL